MNRFSHTLILMAVLLLPASCGEQGPESPDSPVPLTKAEEGINAAANSFGFDVFHSLYEEEQVLFSPLSASLALSMTATGAAGETASQMTRALGFDGFTTEDVNGYYRKMVETLLEVDPGTALEIANSLWISDGIKVRQGFIDDCKEFYSSDVYPADFSSQATIDKVNKWCSDRTHGKISSILDEPDPLLVMALINALYFNGTWATRFEEVYESPFTAISGKKKDMEMMHLGLEASYSEYDGFRMVDLPYGNGSFSMKVILNDTKEDYGKAILRFDASTLDKLNAAAVKKTVSLTMPKFSFDCEYDLKDALVSLGMELPFNSFEADFSKMSEGLYISFVKQKTFIDVNENGAEAAAVTIVGMRKNSSEGSIEDYIEFTANRPFLFVIQENSTGAVLFIGQKVN